jgi:putative FmdB family regulatory protein
VPIYEYLCKKKKCGRVTEVVKKMTDEAPVECQKCGGKTVRIISRTSPPKFIGSGFTPRFYS